MGGEASIVIATEHLLLFLIACVAFVLKAMTGFGPALVVVAVGSLFLPPPVVIATSAILDLIAGAILLRADWTRGSYRFWVPLAVAIVAGSIVGAFFLRAIPADHFRRLLGIAILGLGVWFALGRQRTPGVGLAAELPARSSGADRLFTFVGGVLGGMLGISGPPIIWHFGRRLTKQAFRQVLVPIFVIAALARASTYSALGLVDRQVLGYVAAALPGLLMGLLVGNRIFLRLSEAQFSRIVGLVLLLVALRLLLA